VRRRLPLIIAVVVALDFLLWGVLWYWLGWKPALLETAITAAVGVAIIVYYERRWSRVVETRIDDDPERLDANSLDKLLLLAAGVVFLIPGVVTDLLGLLLLMPGVRRSVVNLLQMWS
jgi:UPF0716 protein FxsA